MMRVTQRTPEYRAAFQVQIRFQMDPPALPRPEVHHNHKSVIQTMMYRVYFWKFVPLATNSWHLHEKLLQYPFMAWCKQPNTNTRCETISGVINNSLCVACPEPPDISYGFYRTPSPVSGPMSTICRSGRGSKSTHAQEKSPIPCPVGIVWHFLWWRWY